MASIGFFFQSLTSLLYTLRWLLIIFNNFKYGCLLVSKMTPNDALFIRSVVNIMTFLAKEIFPYFLL